MTYRQLGTTGLQVSPVCLGTMPFGGDTDAEEAGRIFARCRDAGVNFYDTADGYTGGRSEAILGSLIADCRDEVIIATKVFSTQSEDVNDRGLSRRHVMMNVARSLERLATDRIDILYCHQFDPSVSIEQVLRAFDDLVRAGTVLYVGVSNWAAWQIATALGICALRHLTRIDVLQPMYNLAKRQVEVEILPLARAERLAVVPYSPLGGGLFSGKYSTSARPADGRLVANDMYSRRYHGEGYFETAEHLTSLAEQAGVHPATLAVAWVMSRPGVTAPIIGAKSVAQLEPSLAALEYELPADLEREITGLTPVPPPATDRSESQVPR